MTADGQLVEIQGTAEKAPFHRSELDALLTLAELGIDEIAIKQRTAVQAGGMGN
jgi:ribonuclease PH